MKSLHRSPIAALAAAFSCFSCASAFSIPGDMHAIQSAAASLHLDALQAQYQAALEHHPLPTQIATGASLAVVGDAIAQSSAKDQDGYNVQRAMSFAAFDMAYRTLQHAIFPWIADSLHGQYLGAIPVLGDNLDPFILTTTEMTLFNQLGVIPFIYYPVFFWISGSIQGLNLEASIQRAQGMFLPILKRNLMFWIPVQFLQFGYCPEELWIPTSCVAGLVWTVILSLFAGSAAKSVPAESSRNVEELMARQAAESAAALSSTETSIARETASEARV